jgi:uncharacterized alkaline shock family protein YloU/uncharacterized membrane protein YidH (DUF202 family)
MKLFTWIIMTLYIILFILLGIGLVAFALHWLPVEETVSWLEAVYTEQRFRIACFLIGVGLILLNWMYAELALARFQRQKMIAFENPDGQVTISLMAIEDFLRRSIQDLPEVKDLRSDVVARKGKIVVRARATLFSDVHIPEVTERVQAVIKGKVQEMLAGIEEPIWVQVHVAKIVQREEKEPHPVRGQKPFVPHF